MRSRSASEKHSIERPACVVSVHTVFGRPVSFAGGAAQGVTSFAGPGSFGITVLRVLILLTEPAGYQRGSVRLQADGGGELSPGRGRRIASAMRSGRDLQIRTCTVLNSFRGSAAS